MLIFAHRPLRVCPGKNQHVALGYFLELAQDVDGLSGERHNMWPAGLHPFFGDCPGSIIQVELGPRCLTQFTWSNGCQYQKSDRVMSKGMDVRVFAFAQKLG